MSPIKWIYEIIWYFLMENYLMIPYMGVIIPILIGLIFSVLLGRGSIN